MLVGGAVAVGWASPVGTPTTAILRLIDWDTATQVATRVSGADGGISILDRARLQDEYETMVREIEGPIADYTGTTCRSARSTSGCSTARSGSRRTSPASSRCSARSKRSTPRRSARAAALVPGMTKLSRTMLSGQVGLLLGFLARKVLGQYDISLLGHEPLQAGKLYFVEPNIRPLEGTLQVPADDLRKWIALHEATHAHEFEVNPWVRGYLNGQLDAYLRSMAEEMTSRGRQRPRWAGHRGWWSTCARART